MICIGYGRQAETRRLISGEGEGRPSEVPTHPSPPQSNSQSSRLTKLRLSSSRTSLSLFYFSLLLSYSPLPTALGLLIDSVSFRSSESLIMRKPSKAAATPAPQEQHSNPAPTSGMVNASSQMSQSHNPGGHFNNLYGGLHQSAYGDGTPYGINPMDEQEETSVAPSFHGYAPHNPETSQVPAAELQVYHFIDRGRHAYQPLPIQYHPQAQFQVHNQYAQAPYNFPPSPAEQMRHQQDVQSHDQSHHLQFPYYQQHVGHSGEISEGVSASNIGNTSQPGTSKRGKTDIINLGESEDESEDEEDSDDEPLIKRTTKSPKSEIRSPPAMQAMPSPKVVVPKQKLVMKLKNTPGTNAEQSTSTPSQPPKTAAQPAQASAASPMTATQKLASTKKKQTSNPTEPSGRSSTSARDDAETPDSNGQSSDSQGQEMADTEPISWKLPEYEVLDVTEDKDFPSVKVTVPGMIREEVLLKPQHPKLSVILLREVFIPLHQHLYPAGTNDPDPAYSILNFTTIANIVAGVYFTRKEDGYKVEEADTDEVFFSAMDNWRVGTATARERYETIRGVQEFCDVALDVVFWIKEYGLGEEAEPRKRKQRSDKGVKRGPKGPRKNKEGADSEAVGEGGVAGEEVKNKEDEKKSSEGVKEPTVLKPKRAPKAKKSLAAKTGGKGPTGAAKSVKGGSKGKTANNKVQGGRVKKNTAK